ncbi:CAP domain-containing protein [Calothrix sp. NIES-3974]|uniref:CAP domain-containing protein n=1 Tax=Calothrix sp. NIES-3974 TaxID=2005462 RepID=UPI0018D57C24
MGNYWKNKKNFATHPCRDVIYYVSTGNWVDVGHYTQIIWRNTTEVGCAIATAGVMIF